MLNERSLDDKPKVRDTNTKDTNEDADSGESHSRGSALLRSTKRGHRKSVMMALALMIILVAQMFKQKNKTKTRIIYGSLAIVVAGFLLKKGKEKPLISKYARNFDSHYLLEFFKKFVVESTTENAVEQISQVGEKLAGLL
ncbi:hypothetical protein H4219_002039 [Mycoemilia scoparia]|uniref:Uncharacterized protein n=1 Tax=Mycoemilia scoparia TaxID=417184 RepID=A0A9W8DVB0_9FUNG|nr:hypothetical protein H4219_002039 [Mycoemilia scoparia]